MLFVSDLFNIVPFFLMEITLSLNLGKYPGSYIHYLNIEMETKPSFTCAFVAAGISPNFCNVSIFVSFFLDIFELTNIVMFSSRIYLFFGFIK